MPVVYFTDGTKETRAIGLHLADKQSVEFAHVALKRPFPLTQLIRRHAQRLGGPDFVVAVVAITAIAVKLCRRGTK